MQVLFTILTVLFIFASLALVIIILVQRPQGGGLSAAFGGSGAGGSETAFGGRTGDALTVTTITAFIIYLGLAMGLNIVDDQLVRPAPAIVDPAATPGAPGTPAVPGAPGAPGATGAPITTGAPGTPGAVNGLPPGITLTPIAPPTGVAPGTTGELPQTIPPTAAPGATTPPAAPPATTP